MPPIEKTKTVTATATTPAPKRRVRKAPLVDRSETPDARFQRLARKRLGRAIVAMKSLEALGNSRARKDDNGEWKRNKDGSTSGYSYTPAQAEKILQYLSDAVASVKTALAPRAASKAVTEMIDL